MRSRVDLLRVVFVNHHNKEEGWDNRREVREDNYFKVVNFASLKINFYH